MVDTAVVLAAGRGRRLDPLTRTRPKPMVPVVNRPLLEYVVEACSSAGVSNLVFVVGYKRERIQSYFGDGDDWNVDLDYVVQEKQLGTGHALLQAEDLIGDGSFLVLNGDSIVSGDLVRKMMEADGDGTVMAVSSSDRPSDYGVVETRDGEVVSIREKPQAAESNLVNAGVYRFPRDVFDLLQDVSKAGGERDLTSAVDAAVEEGGVEAVSTESWTDVSYLWDLVQVNSSVMAEGEGAPEDAEEAYVAAETAIGDDVHVAANASVLPGSSLDDNVSVGAGAVVANTVLMKDAIVGEGAVVRDTVVGEGARIGANSTFEGGEADVVVEDRLHRGVKLGGVVGDYSRLGGDVTATPGAVVGEDVEVETGCMLSGKVESGSRVTRG